MKTCWRITKNDKTFIKHIYKMFLRKYEFSHIEFAFNTWLDNDSNEIILQKNEYILTSNNLPQKDIVLDIKNLLISLN